MRIWLLLISLSLIPTTIPTSYAKDFGTRGHVYQIIEQPFLQMISDRLQKIDLAQEQAKITSILKDRVASPGAVAGLMPATTNRVFYFDPTYTLAEDAVLPCGKILHKAGTKVNPLEHMTLARRLLFIDGREPAQIQWLKQQLTDAQGEESTEEQLENRIILVGGSVLLLQAELSSSGYKEQVYFDQNGELTTKFGIKASPALALQDGLRIKIEEIACK